MKLGFILEPTAPNSYYRVVFPMYALERRGHSVLWPASGVEDAPMRSLLECDLVHCLRRTDRLRDLKQLSQRGVAISFDNDDDLTASDLSSEGERIVTGAKGRLRNVRKFSEMLKVARFADLTTTPSESLAARYREAGAQNVAVLENYLDESMAGFGVRKPHEGLVLGWIAGKEHEVDLRKLNVAATVQALLDRHSSLSVQTVGCRLPLDSDRHEHRKFVPFTQLLEVVGGFDIGIAPLADTPLNRARSNIKLKEYAAAGVTWVASPVGAYHQMGERQGGQVVSDDRWLEVLDKLVRSPLRRRRLARQALRWARSETVNPHAPLWEEHFSEAVSRATARSLRRAG